MAVGMKKLNIDYYGYMEVGADDLNLAQVYQDLSVNPYGLQENGYLIVKSDGKASDIMKWQNERFKKVVPITIDDTFHGKIKPLNPEQVCAIDMLTDTKTTVKVITGNWGSGKSFLSMACAFRGLSKGLFDKIVFVHNNIETKNSSPIGYLKGSYYEKMEPWCMMIADYLGDKDMLQVYLDRGSIQVEHLGFLRGRSFSNSVIWVTEAQNLTRDHMQLLLGRVAEGSVLILDGDARVEQIDRKTFEEDNGLCSVITNLKGNRLFGYVHLRESVRSETAKLADLLDKNEGE